MANLPYSTGNESKVLGIMKMYSRMGAYPLDATSVFNTKAELEAYIAETGSYAYPGQVVAVANGNIANASQDDDYSVYVIRSDKTVQEIGKNLTFSSTADATAFISSNPNGIRTGELLTIADDEAGYLLYMVKADKSLQRVSFDISTDVPELDWANITNKPTSAIADIDEAVTNTHTHANKVQVDKIGENSITNKPTYNGNELAYKSDVVWDTLGDTHPTTLGGYGITDAYLKTEADNTFVPVTDVVTDAAANKLLKLDDAGKLPASVITGVLSIENIPAGALERCVVVENDAARFALTSSDVQLGDTVKVTETNKMYFVKNASSLDSEEGYEVYTAGSASSVAWSGVTGKPTNLAGYGITDAVNSSDVVTVAEANKLLKLDANAKLPTSITGDADTVDGKHATDFVAATDVVTEAEANKLLKLDASGKLPTSITGDAATVNGKSSTDFVAATDVVTEATANKLLKLNGDGDLDANITGNATTATTAVTATNVAWAGVQDKPTSAVADIDDAVTKAHTHTNKTQLDKFGESDTKPTYSTNELAYKSEIVWSTLGDTHPTTLSGYGITDAIGNAEIVTTAEANKVLKLNDEAKLPADITGNAATATSVAWAGVQNKPTTVDGYGITDVYTTTDANATFVPVTDVSTVAAANKLLKLNENGKFDANVLTGTVPLSVLPHGALERCVVVNNDTARFALTSAQVQAGDTVKVTSTSKMYFVVDDTKLGTEAGYEVYTAGTATSVPWAGVTDTPTSISGYGITDAYTKTETDSTFVNKSTVVTVATANKVLQLNADGDLPTNITGNAATATSVAWAGVQSKPTTVAGYGITDVYTTTDADAAFVASSDVVTTAVPNKVLKLDATGKLPTDITGTAGAVAWANIIGKPSSTAADIDDAVTKKHAHTNKTALDTIGIDSETNRMSVTVGEDVNNVAYMSDLTAIIAVGPLAPETLPIGGLWLDTTMTA